MGTIPRMTLVIGVDEAGYGPNLGPLVVGLSAWEVRGQRSEVRESQATIDLYQLLEDVVSDAPDSKRIAVADSKALYKPGGGLALLERGVLSMLAASGRATPTCYDTLVDTLAADADGCRTCVPWHQNGFNPDVPVDSCPNELAAVCETVRDRFGIQAGAKVAVAERSDSTEYENSGGSLRSSPAAQDGPTVTLYALRGRLVFPEEFNAACEQYASKGLALSHWTLSLLKETLKQLSSAPSPQPLAPTYVTCDKHGGRNNYAGLLAEYFPDHKLRVIVESRPRSAYLLEDGGPEIRIEFRSKGESQLETALASMVAKYLRELSMQAFNAFWRSHLPELNPTAGYPVDAKRFKTEIEAKQHELSIDDAILWRER